MADAGLPVQEGRARLRRRHRGAHQRRHRRSRRRCIVLGKRTGCGKELMAPHSLTMTMIGAALLWVGWFGFNAGSNLEANGTAGLAMLNTFVATAAAAMALGVRRMVWSRASRRCSARCSGAVAGLVAVTPAAASRARWAPSSSASLPASSASIFCTGDQERAGLRRLASTCSASTASAASSALSAAGILVNPASAAPACSTTSPASRLGFRPRRADDLAAVGRRHDVVFCPASVR